MSAAEHTLKWKLVSYRTRIHDIETYKQFSSYAANKRLGKSSGLKVGGGQTQIFDSHFGMSLCISAVSDIPASEYVQYSNEMIGNDKTKTAACKKRCGSY